MNILVINGSPAGDNSITLQTVLYIQKYFSKHNFEFINAGQTIRQIEKDFSASRKAIEAADLLVFCYPVYTFLVPAQLHRFIELMKEAGMDLSDKFATQITTSKHFYDTTAHQFIDDNCADLGLRYINGLSADMEDLLHKKGRKEALSFFHHVLWTIKRGYAKDSAVVFTRALSHARSPLSCAYVPERAQAPSDKARIAIVADLAKGDRALRDMIFRFMAVCNYKCSLINIHDFPFAGGCLGCFHCASDGKCVYNDGFEELLRERIQTADACVYAFTIKDHSMGYRFKLFDDRQFCNGHRTVTMGKPVGYIINGVLSAEPNLRTLIEARAQVGGNHLAGIAANESRADQEIDQLSDELSYAIRHHYSQPANFYGVGGLKIFRDLIWQMQGLMREDHRFYKAHGFYDFPQKKKGTVLGMYAVGALMHNRKLQKKLGANMTEGMLMPYKKVLEQVTIPVTQDK
ncbi:MAG: NAD(P)H-dependent oxidoreductase [Lachnospiraceae bacterium]|nr:NAD(P)H-dependent oxidoreductase [Lachnospiraceae bacterium]